MRGACPRTAGSRFWQAPVTALIRDTLTPSCRGLEPGNFPMKDGGGSGKFGTPCERIQREKASADGGPAGPPAFGEPPEPVNEGLPPHAAVSSTRPAVTARTPARRGRARHQRRQPPASSFMLPSSKAETGCFPQ